MRRLRFLPVLGVLAAVSIAVAAEPPIVGDEARSHYQNGVKLYYDEGNVVAAIVEFRRAYDLSKNWQILFALGQASYELRDHAAALSWFSKYLRDGGPRVPAERRKTVEGDIEQLTKRIARITVRCNVAGADVRVDGQAIGQVPVSDHVLNVGEHEVTVSRVGWETVSRRVLLAMRDAEVLTFDLKAVGTPIASSNGRAAVWPYFGAAALAAGLGIGFGLAALDEKSTLDSSCPEKLCAETSRAAWNAMHRDAIISTAAFATSIATAVVGTVVVLRGRDRKPSWWATVGPTHLGIRRAF